MSGAKGHMSMAMAAAVSVADARLLVWLVNHKVARNPSADNFGMDAIRHARVIGTPAAERARHDQRHKIPSSPDIQATQKLAFTLRPHPHCVSNHECRKRRIAR